MEREQKVAQVVDRHRALEPLRREMDGAGERQQPRVADEDVQGQAQRPELRGEAVHAVQVLEVQRQAGHPGEAERVARVAARGGAALGAQLGQGGRGGGGQEGEVDAGLGGEAERREEGGRELRFEHADGVLAAVQVARGDDHAAHALVLQQALHDLVPNPDIPSRHKRNLLPLCIPTCEYHFIHFLFLK